MRTSHKHILCMHATDSRLACFGAGGLVVLVLNVTCRMQYCLSEWMSEREMTLQHTNAAAETAHRRKKKQNKHVKHTLLYCNVLDFLSTFLSILPWKTLLHLSDNSCLPLSFPSLSLSLWILFSCFPSRSSLIAQSAVKFPAPLRKVQGQQFREEPGRHCQGHM